MKKLLAIIAAMLAIINVAHAYDFESGGIYYRITSQDDKTVEVTSGDTKYSGDVVIPKTVTYSDAEYTVTTIGDWAFYDCISLTSIKLPSSLTSIGESAFNYCSSLTSIEMSSSLTSIGEYAFQNCRSLTSIELPASVTSIGYVAFSWCYSLKTVTSLNPEPPTLGESVFYECPIETVYVPTEAVEAYQAAEGWKDLVIEDAASKDLATEFEADGIYYHITSFANKTVDVTFQEQWQETPSYNGDLIIPEKVTYSNTEYNVTAIGDRAFFNCESLTSIELPSSLISIGESAFCNCTSLTSVKFPKSLTSIGDWAFDGCSSLASIDLPASLTAIGEMAFYDCSSLTSIELPALVTKIGYQAFAGCESLQEISVSEENETFSSIDGILYDKNVSTLVCCPGGMSSEFAIPSSVTEIGHFAFEYCRSLTRIELPSSLISIGNCAFKNCSSLTSIKIPSSVSSIGYFAFEYCRSLTNIELPASLTEIVSYTFYNCSSLTSIELPASVISIGYSAFYNCSSLTSIELPASLTTIDDSAFESCSSLTSIELPATVTEIGDRAFEFCRSLTSIKIPSSVKEIYDFAFAYCHSLKMVISLNPESPTLGFDVFLDCSIETVYVPTEAVTAYQPAEGWSEFNIVGMSNVGDEAVPVYVVSDIVEEEGTVQEAREEVSFNFVEYSEVATGQGTATLTREGSSEVVNLPAAEIAGEAAQARALRVVAADGKDYQVVQPLGDAATDAGNYTIHFPEGYFLLGTQKENSPAFTMSFTVGDMSSITDAIIDSTDAEYYTLQGVKVQGKPAPGIYICRQGNKATKVVVK